MNLDQALQTFIAEARELLDDMESTLVALARGEGDDDSVHAIFRVAHTIKGSAGLFGLDNIVAFTHSVESVLDRVRDHQLAVTESLTTLLLACRDHVAGLIDGVESGSYELSDQAKIRANALVTQLHTFLPAPAAAAPAPSAPGQRSEPAHGEVASLATGDDHWHISVRFGPDVLRDGMDPLSFARYLQTLGDIAAIVTLPDAIPGPEQMDPETCYIGFELALQSAADKTAIEGAFEFVRETSQIRILPPRSRISEYIRLIEELPEESARLGGILVQCGSVTDDELEAALRAQADKADKRVGEILVEQRSVHNAVVDAAVAKQAQVREGKAQENRSIRVDAEKLDHLINVVGELIIAGAGAGTLARDASPELQERISAVAELVEEVRDSALQLRMVKIGSTFKRFHRVVHDVSREMGKDIELVVTGEDTELDKTLVEKLADPLTHLVRNAIDHGIEPALVRRERGKAARGTVKLSAYHDSGCIVIEVSDDGGGLKRDRILAKAIERGLVASGRSLTDGEIYDFVFEAGFSTADQVTSLSGRGVGMDVVKRNIAALRGTVQIASEEGRGTTVTVRLPLTLAIIDGFLVSIANSNFVIPLDVIDECVEFSCEPGHDYTNLRGEVLPFVRLRQLFEIEGAPPRRENIVVVRQGPQKAGLVVDNLIGEFQTVIKPLGRMFANVKCISGSTILGSGELALILDVAKLLDHVHASRATAGTRQQGDDANQHSQRQATH